MVKKDVTTWSWNHVNDQPAIWTRSKEDIKDEEYEAFYKSISKDFEAPLKWTHFKAEGEIEFRSILYVPQKPAPGELEKYYEKKPGLKLYVRKVLISDSFEDLIPKYLSFVRGLVDSDDLPVNVNRETLQQSRVLKVIGKKLVRKILELLRKMAREEDEAAKKTTESEGEDDEDDDEEELDEEKTEDEGVYTKFWNEFGKHLKLGVMEDSSNKAKLMKLLRFPTTKSDGKSVSLDSYIERMPETQESIYYIAAESVEACKRSPFLERATSKGVEVLLLGDALDEYVMQQTPTFEGKKFVSVSKEGLKFGDETEEDSKREKLYIDMYKPLTDFMKSAYGGKVSKVTVSNRVTTTPAILVTSQYGYSANMERIMKSQAMGAGMASYMKSQKTMEINPRHPIVSKLLASVQENAEDNAEATDLSWLLYDTALLSSGFDMEDPTDFSGRMYRLMKTSLQLDSLDLEAPIEVPEEEEQPEEEVAELEDEDEVASEAAEEAKEEL
jgi:heat shock protein beta